MEIAKTPRDAYLGRRAVAEQYFNLNPLKQEVQTLADGSKVEIRYGEFDIPQNLQTGERRDPSVKRITIFLPGAPHYPRSDSTNINDARENKMLGSLVKGNTDKVILLKPSGINDQAYIDSETGKGVGQAKVADVATQYLREQLEKSPAAKYVFDLVGYSEGSTQAASIAVRITEQGLGEVVKVTSMGGLGFTGPTDQHRVPDNILSILLSNFKAGVNFQAPEFPIQDSEGNNLYHIQKGDDLIVSQRLLADKHGGLEKSLGEKELKGLDRWVRDPKILATVVGKHLISRLLGTDGFPIQRLKAMFSRNPDWDTLVARGIKLRVFIGQRDQYYTVGQMENAIQRLRSLGADIKTVASDVGHEFPHVHPSSVGWITENLN